VANILIVNQWHLFRFDPKTTFHALFSHRQIASECFLTRFGISQNIRERFHSNFGALQTASARFLTHFGVLRNGSEKFHSHFSFLQNLSERFLILFGVFQNKIAHLRKRKRFRR
jgi:hypothetical protein